MSDIVAQPPTLELTKVGTEIKSVNVNGNDQWITYVDIAFDNLVLICLRDGSAGDLCNCLSLSHFGYGVFEKMGIEV